MAVIRGVPYANDLVETVTLYPPAGAGPATEEESLYWEGPEIEELPVGVRDALAAIDDERLSEVARRWAREPLSSFDENDDVRDLVKELVALARRARESDEMLYCWWISG